MQSFQGLEPVSICILILCAGYLVESDSSTASCENTGSQEGDSERSPNWSSLFNKPGEFVQPILSYDLKYQFLSSEGLQKSNRLAVAEFGPFFEKKRHPKERSQQNKQQERVKDKKRPMKVPDLIRAAGYDFETHNVTTQDGYELTLFRIKENTVCKFEEPLDRYDFSILFQHGFMGTAADWLVVERDRALRNEYSKRHKWLKPIQPQFWNFSFDEMGRYDTPITLDYILNTTKAEDVKGKGKEILFVSHGMGTTIYYVCMSLFNEKYKKIVTGIISLGPSAFLSRMTSPLKALVPYTKQYSLFTNDGPLVPSTITSFLHFTNPELCRVQKNNRSICSTIELFLNGDGSTDVNVTTLTRVAGQFPSTTSVKTFVHYLQQIEKDKFRNFDYGTVDNMKRYNQPVPPLYNLFNVSAYNLNLYGHKDILLDSRDVERTVLETGTARSQVNVLLMDFIHMDFIYGKVGPLLAYALTQFALNIRYVVYASQTRCFPRCKSRQICKNETKPQHKMYLEKYLYSQ